MIVLFLFPVAPQSGHQLVQSAFLNLATMVSMKWFLIVIFISRSLVTNDLLHFMDLLTSCTFSFKKCLWKNFDHFYGHLCFDHLIIFVDHLYFCYWFVKVSLYISCGNLPSVWCFANIFSNLWLGYSFT